MKTCQQNETSCDLEHIGISNEETRTMNEWLTNEEVEDLTGYGAQALLQMRKKKIIPPDKTKKEGRRRYFHSSLIDFLIEHMQEYQDFIKGAQPKDVFEYDGYFLNEEQARRLEEVRHRNGYSITHPLVGMSVEDKIFLAKMHKNT